MDRQITKIKQMAAGCDRLQYLVDKSHQGPERVIQPNTRRITSALSESHVDKIKSG